MKKGIQKLIDYSDKIQDYVLNQYLKDCQADDKIVKVHRECQREVYNELKRKSNVAPSQVKKAKSTRASIGFVFNWKKDCFFCAKPCVVNKKHPDRNDFRQVCTLPMRNKVLQLSAKRSDSWALEVQRRVLHCHDLVAAEARYHKSCRDKFYFGTDGESIKSPGRPTNEKCLNNFSLLCEWLESEGEMYSLTEIHKKMMDIAAGDDNVYSQVWLKKKLEERYKLHIFFTDLPGKSNIVCFRNIVQSFYGITRKKIMPS